jgi:hypothetical protein
MSKNKLTVIQAQPPALDTPRSYEDFDQWCLIANRLGEWKTEMEELEERYNKPGYKLSSSLISFHQSVADQYSDKRLDTMLAEWQAGEDWYIRKELYDQKSNGGWRLKREVVSQQVALLIGSFPNAGPHNGEVYTRMLIEEIYRQDPCPCELESACRRIRRTMTFPPSIAEVIRVLDQEGSKWCERWDVMDDGAAKTGEYFRRCRDRLKAFIAKAKEELATEKKVAAS